MMAPRGRLPDEAERVSFLLGSVQLTGGCCILLCQIGMFSLVHSGFTFLNGGLCFSITCIVSGIVSLICWKLPSWRLALLYFLLCCLCCFMSIVAIVAVTYEMNFTNDFYQSVGQPYRMPFTNRTVINSSDGKTYLHPNDSKSINPPKEKRALPQDKLAEEERHAKMHNESILDKADDLKKAANNETATNEKEVPTITMLSVSYFVLVLLMMLSSVQLIGAVIGVAVWLKAIYFVIMSSQNDKGVGYAIDEIDGQLVLVLEKTIKLPSDYSHDKYRVRGSDNRACDSTVSAATLENPGFMPSRLMEDSLNRSSLVIVDQPSQDFSTL